MKPSIRQVNATRNKNSKPTSENTNLFGGLLILVTSALKTHTDTLGHVADTHGPHILIEGSVDTDVAVGKKAIQSKR